MSEMNEVTKDKLITDLKLVIMDTLTVTFS